MWLARTKDNILYLFYNRPTYSYDKDDWDAEPGDNEWMQLPSEEFWRVTYENSPIDCSIFTKTDLTEMLQEQYNEGFGDGEMNGYSYGVFDTNDGE